MDGIQFQVYVPRKLIITASLREIHHGGSKVVGVSLLQN